jgi:hypothetical protein
VAAAPAGGQGQDPLPEGRHVVLGRSVEGRAIRAVRVGDLDAAEVAEGR